MPYTAFSTAPSRNATQTVAEYIWGVYSLLDDDENMSLFGQLGL
jgi:hypothetical protein